MHAGVGVDRGVEEVELQLEVEQVEVESRKESEDKVSAEATNILGNRSSGGEVPTNVRDGRKVCISATFLTYCRKQLI